MSQSLSDILIHVVFSTKERRPMIRPEIEEELYRYISALCRDAKSPVIRIGGVADHLHILLSLARTISASDLIVSIKANSSRWIKTKGEFYRIFSWQNGYGAFSVSQSMRARVVNYIAQQKEHHQKISFKEEFLMMLQKANIEFDERFLWD